jgi:subtilisin family serine protease
MFTPSWSRSSSLRLAITLAACCALMPLQSFAEGPARAVASTAIEGQYIVVLQDSNTDPAAFARRAGHPMARFVQANQVVKANAQVLPDGINRANADTNTTAMIDGVDQRVDVDVAIIDTGIDPTHPDLNVVGGANFTKGKSSQWQDQNGHGTPRRRHGRRAR